MTTTNRGHETEGIRVNAVALTAAGLCVTLVVIGVVAWGLLKWWSRPAAPQQGIDRNVSLRDLPATPAALDRLPELRRQLEAEQRANLQRRQWTDRNHTHARIPIERAMRWIETHGLPEFETAAPAADNRKEQSAP